MSTAPRTWQVFRYVTLPLLRPSLGLALILCVTGSLLAFDQFFILTKGGPENSTVTIVQVIYREAFQRQNLGTAAALSVGLLVGARADQPRPAPPPARNGELRWPQTAPATAFSRTPNYVLTGGLAILFLFPLAWTVFASVSPQSFTGQTHGFGFGNYTTLFKFGVGLPMFLFNSLYVSIATVALTLDRLDPGRLRLRALQVLGPRSDLPGHPLDPDGALRVAADPALRAAQRLRPRQLAPRRRAHPGDVPAPVRHLHDAHLLRGGAARARGFRARRRLQFLRRALAHHASCRAAGSGHGRPLRLPGGLERLLRAADPAHAIRPRRPCLWPSQLCVPRSCSGRSISAQPRPASSSWRLPCVILFLLLQRYYVRGFMSGAIKG